MHGNNGSERSPINRTAHSAGKIAKSGLMRSRWVAIVTPDPANAPCAVRVFAV
jgi:hypothetical protein